MELLLLLMTLALFVSSLLCLISINTVHSIFWLIFSFINSIVLMILNNMNIIAIMILIIYVGAIAILFLFSVMMINLSAINILNDLYFYLILPFFFFFLIIYIKIINLNSWYQLINDINVKTVYPIMVLINELYSNLSWYIIISSLILLIPMIGVLIIIKIILLLYFLSILSIMKVIYTKANSKLITLIYSISMLWVSIIMIHMNKSTFNINSFNKVNFIKKNLYIEWSELIIGYDYLSCIFIFLTIILIISCIIISWKNIKVMISEFCLLLLITQLFLFIIFTSFDMILFYIFFEIVLIPIFLIIIIWGSRIEKFKAAYYFFFYTLVGSMLMLLSFFYIYNEIGSTSWYHILSLKITKSKLIAITICISMGVKIPMIPFHIWLPQAHVEAPISGSILLAGILLKLGGYGLIRFGITLFYEDLNWIKPFTIMISLVAIIYGSLITIRQIDVKRMVAYSSVSHMGFVTLGIFSQTNIGLTSSVILMIAHGFVSSALFISVTILYDRFHTRLIRNYRGILVAMPILSTMNLILTLANVSFPYTLNFWGEILTFKSIIYLNFNYWIIIICSISLLFSSIYSFNLYNKIHLGVSHLYNVNLRDLCRKEGLILIVFILLTIIYGINPTSIISNIYINISFYLC